MDENLHNHLDKLFRDSIEPLSELPGSHIWENIEKSLDKNNAAQYKRKYIIFKRLAVVLLFLLLSFATFILINNNKTGNNTADNINVTKKERSVNINDPSSNNYNQGPKYQNNVPGISLLIDKNKRKGLLEKRLPAKIKSGNTEQNLSVNKNEQLSYASNFLSRAIAGAVYDSSNTLIKLPVVQLNRTAINDTGVNNVKNLSEAVSKKDNKPTRRFFMAAFMAPEYANYTLENDETNHYENKQVIQKRERHLFSYSAGIMISYNFNKIFALQSGITWSSSNINIDPNKIYAVKANSVDIKYRYNTSSGYGYILPSFRSAPAIGDSLYTRTSVHTLQFISVPVVARYNFIHKRFSLNPGVGFAFNFLTKASLATEVNDDTNSESETITKLNGLKKISYSLLFTSELQYRASKKWSFIAVPYFKYALTPINKRSVVKTYPYNIGLGIGLKHKL